ncbi:hypothetical protein [Dietzia sp. PP-33]|mgnify:CR=1 FL=1|jgi:hypothetical protein|uniref:hypothetical protein n=1 Tax=Dietzia sp. PP-33 TaxID=2957500 RepID=UPI0029A04527|nr:hypothetical protein [Dietzia sp. PP-33]MDX2356148.1 hypothetical protein [Dietzia sp. PP-33]
MDIPCERETALLTSFASPPKGSRPVDSRGELITNLPWVWSSERTPSAAMTATQAERVEGRQPYRPVGYIYLVAVGDTPTIYRSGYTTDPRSRLADYRKNTGTFSYPTGSVGPREYLSACIVATQTTETTAQRLLPRSALWRGISRNAASDPLAAENGFGASMTARRDWAGARIRASSVRTLERARGVGGFHPSRYLDLEPVETMTGIPAAVLRGTAVPVISADWLRRWMPVHPQTTVCGVVDGIADEWLTLGDPTELLSAPVPAGPVATAGALMTAGLVTDAVVSGLRASLIADARALGTDIRGYDSDHLTT